MSGNGNASGIVCSACSPNYCACTDFYRGRLAFWRGDLDAVWLASSRQRIIMALKARGA